MADYGLVLATDTNCNEMSEIYSMIDHCLMSRNLYDRCDNVCIIDSVDHFSYQLPVCIKFNVKPCRLILDKIVRVRDKLDSESV